MNKFGKFLFASAATVMLFGNVGSINANANTQTGNGTQRTVNWEWSWGTDGPRQRFFSSHTHRTLPHGTGIVRSDGVRGHTGIQARGTNATMTLATNGPRTAVFHRFENTIPLSFFRTLNTGISDRFDNGDNEHYFAYMTIDENNSIGFVLETLHPDIHETGFQVTVEYFEDGTFVEDNKMIFIDEDGNYQEQIKEIVSRKNRNRNMLNSINYEEVLNEIQVQLENGKNAF